MFESFDLATHTIKVKNDGYDSYSVYFRIKPRDKDYQWVPYGKSYFGCASFGVALCSDPIKFSSVKDAVNFIKEEFGNYGISLLVDEDFKKVDVSKFLK